ncbi:MAG: ATP synthase F1 subunit delta [Coriobacteriales bacterium]|nr:ATP synthase F1 subunit delta [Coriobacteriales bacterium]
MANNRLITKRVVEVYAGVLLEAAQADGRETVFALAGQLQQLIETVRGSVELEEALQDQGIAAEAKVDLARRLFPADADCLFALLKVMFERDDLKLLAQVRDAYTAGAEAALGAQFMDVTTAVPLDAATRQGLLDKYQQEFGCDVLLREHVDAKLIGGIIISTHGRVLDASVSAQLKRARRVLSQVRGGER